MDATRATKIKELDEIKLTVPLEGADVFDEKAVYQLPAGTEGTVVYVFGNGEAFEVEFLIWPEPEKMGEFISVEIVVRSDQCEPV